MQSSPTILIAVVCVFLLIILMMVAFVIVAAGKGKARHDTLAKALGLSLLEDTLTLLNRVAYVNNITRPELYRVENVYSRHSSSGDVYMFGFHRRDIKGPTVSNKSRSSKIHYHPLETDVLAFVSSTWNLPHFAASPRLSGEGKLTAIANQITEAAAGIKMEVVKFQHIPNLDDRYLISTSDFSASRISLPDAFLRTLSANPNLTLHTGGDTLTISYANSASQPPDAEKMKQLYKIGVQMARDIPAKA
ncbi:MAG: hypothetical protein IPN96_14285 [Anaerolineales bacterium]|nr:hypothetical protein [Anaerolineales bacterium]